MCSSDSTNLAFGKKMDPFNKLVPFMTVWHIMSVAYYMLVLAAYRPDHSRCVF